MNNVDNVVIENDNMNSYKYIAKYDNTINNNNTFIPTIASEISPRHRIKTSPHHINTA